MPETDLKNGLISTIRQERHLFASTLIWIVIAIAVTTWANQDSHFPVGYLVAATGGIGGLLALFRRLQFVPSNELSATGSPQWRRKVIAQLYLSPIEGALIATVAYLLFVTGVIAGDMFPAFTGSDGAFESTKDAFRAPEPASVKDFYKLVLWSALAGYSERMIPNVLDRLIQRDRVENEADEA